MFLPTPTFSRLRAHLDILELLRLKGVNPILPVSGGRVRWGRGVAREQLPTTNCYPGEEPRAPGHRGSERLQEKGNLKPSDLRSVQVATIVPARAVSAEPARREGGRPRAGDAGGAGAGFGRRVPTPGRAVNKAPHPGGLREAGGL